MRRALSLTLFIGFLPFLASAESCFDYYKFQSVEIDLHGEKQVYKSGEGAKFIGSLANKNSYPMVGGSLILRVSKLDPKSQLGNDIIEEWTAKDNINLMAGEKQPISISYQLSSGLPTGTYILTSYFLTQNKFNISGLPFTDDIYGGYATFSVEGKSEKAIKFDRSGVKIDSKLYRIFGFLPQIFSAGTETLSVSVPLKNDNAKAVSADISYSLYVWDGIDKSNLIKTWVDKIDISKQSSKTLSFDVPLSGRPVYFLKITAKAGDQRSEIRIRLAKDGFRPRLNFVGITQFPAGDKNSNTLFACYHNTSNGEGNGRLDVSVKNSDGRVLSDATFSGKITGAIDVLTKDISNLRGYDKLILSAKLYDDKNNLVDQSDISYDCSKFSADLCVKRSFNVYFFGAGFILIIIALYFIKRHFNTEVMPLK
ncbi:MAG: hypothetical protein Q8Q46_02195 [Candidatus Giovannonibacteria bacterium]|nr:hypothetical protein [Candidatus Giovannonibacteria bacterium]